MEENQRQREAEISIHAPRTGSDNAADISNGTEPGFQSTLPARGATLRQYRAKNRQRISIHAPRTGSDRRALEELKEA